MCNVDVDIDLVADEWTRMSTFSAVVGTPQNITDIPAFIANTQELDLPPQEKIRKRVDEVVKDKATAKKLKPWYSGGAKGPVSMMNTSQLLICPTWPLWTPTGTASIVSPKQVWF